MTTNVTKIDAAVVGFRIAKELGGYKTRTGSEVWNPFEPNSFSGTGADIKTAPRSPITGRKRRKGPVVDLDAVTGFNHDFGYDQKMQELLEGVFFTPLVRKGEEAVTSVVLDAANPDEYLVASTAGIKVGDLIQGQGFTASANNGVYPVTVVTTDTAVKVVDGTLVAEASPPAGAKIVVVGHEFATGDIDVSVAGDFATYVSSAFDFTLLGLTPGEPIYVGGDTAGTSFATAGNNGYKRVKSIAAHALVVDRSYGSSAMGTEDNSTTSNAKIRMFFGRIIRDVAVENEVLSSYSAERVLGAPDTASPSAKQSEYIDGCVFNTFKLTIGTAAKLMADFGFMAADAVDVNAATGLRAGSRPALVPKNAFNTSIDFNFIKMAVVSNSDEAPATLFGHLFKFDVSINNNCSPNKAIGTLGSFSVTAGEFNVQADLQAYFTDSVGPQAIRSNADVTIAAGVAANNQGFVIDLPLVGLSGGQKDVQKNKTVNVPMKADAGEAESYDANFIHTVMMAFFDYLPNAAMPS